MKADGGLGHGVSKACGENLTSSQNVFKSEKKDFPDGFNIKYE